MTIPAEPRRKLRPGLVLSVGFGGLIAFLVAAALGALFQLDRVRADDTRIRQAFLGRIRSLEQIRSQIYLSGTDVRDYLLNPDESGAEDQRAHIGKLESETHNALDQYARGLDPAESESFKALRAEIDAYWQVIETAFHWTSAERRRMRYTFFYEQLVPRRTTMLRIADSIAAINERGLNRAEDRLASSAGNLRSSLLITFGVALFGGIVLALGTITLMRRLEKEVELRLTETRELSAKLVSAQEDERRALARELHDEIGQSLSAIMMEAGNVESADDGTRVYAGTGQRLASIITIAENALNSVRDLALLLRPSMLDDFGLVPALNWQAREVGKRTGLGIRVTADEACDELPDEYRTCIYRVVQEALNNAARYSGAKTVQVNVKVGAAMVLFSIQDDGTGFDKRVVRGLGLLGMGERVRRLGGILRIDSRVDQKSGHGTTIAAELPLPDRVKTGAHVANSHSDR